MVGFDTKETAVSVNEFYATCFRDRYCYCYRKVQVPPAMDEVL